MIQIGKEEVRFSLFSYDMVVYISGPKNSTRKLLQMNNTFVMLQDKKLIQQKSVVLLCKDDKLAEEEIKETQPQKT